MTAPETLVYGSLQLYTATAGTARPAQVTTAPGGSYTLLGSGGLGDQAPGGLKVSHPISTSIWRGEGSAPRAVALTEEDLMIEVMIAELTAANYAMALQGKSVTTVSASSGIPGSKGFDLYRGPGKITPVALLIRGSNSPEFAGGIIEYYVPYAVQEANLEPTFNKTDPTQLSFMFRAVEDPSSPSTDRIGQLRIQTAAAL